MINLPLLYILRQKYASINMLSCAKVMINRFVKEVENHYCRHQQGSMMVDIYGR